MSNHLFFKWFCHFYSVPYIFLRIWFFRMFWSTVWPSPTCLHDPSVIFLILFIICIIFLRCSNTLLCTVVLLPSCRLRIFSLKKSPSISCVGQKATLAFLFWFVSNKNYCKFRCRVFLLLDVSPFWPIGVYIQNRVLMVLDVFPLLANRIVLLFSCYIVLVGTYIPCAARKCLVHSNCAIASSKATNYASVDLLVFSLCLLDAVYVAPLPCLINM